MIGPKQIAGDPTPGQRSPHMNGPGSMAILSICRPIGATIARTAAMAEGQGSPLNGDDGSSVSATHTTVAAEGVSVADAVLVGSVPVGAAVGLGASDGTDGLGVGLAHAAAMSIAKKATASRFIACPTSQESEKFPSTLISVM
jgi:hypothetical protein